MSETIPETPEMALSPETPELALSPGQLRCCHPTSCWQYGRSIADAYNYARAEPELSAWTHADLAGPNPKSITPPPTPAEDWGPAPYAQGTWHIVAIDVHGTIWARLLRRLDGLPDDHRRIVAAPGALARGIL